MDIHKKKLKRLQPPKFTEYDSMIAFKDDLYQFCLYKIAMQDDAHIYKDILSRMNNTRDINKDHAKQKDIQEVCRMLDLEMSRNKIHCPYHEERTPSCHVYEKTNSFYCFGCSKGGDVIELVMCTKGYSFIDAVKFLTN